MKSTHCILSADAARARIFALDSADRSTGAAVTRLIEVTEIDHPERRARASEKFSDSRPGSRRGGGTQGQNHGVDDHRDANIEEADRRFAQGVLEALRSSLSSLRANRAIVTASPSMLALLRDGGLPSDSVETTELNKDYSTLSTSQLRDRLVAEGLIPESV